MPRKNEVPLAILGVMTGTSCDGLDAVAVTFSKKEFKLHFRGTAAYPDALRRRALEFQNGGARHSSRGWLEMNRDLGVWYAKVITSIIRKNRLPIHAVANHGQTLAHFPGVGTLQLGDPSIIAARTGLTVISQFRTGDMAAGGQGAPLVPGFHKLLADASGASIPGCSIHNLGGVSNLTYLRDGAAPVAWDTGPGNLWMDATISRRTEGRLLMDRDGRLARLGTPDMKSVSLLLGHPYFKRSLPKSTGRDEFTAEAVHRALKKLPLADALATATLATARSIVRDYCRHILDRGLPLETIYFCGGGSRNSTLIEAIQIEFLQQGWLIQAKTSSALGVDPQDMEAAAFAFLGKESLLGHSLGGAWTGVKGFGPPGHLTPGKNWASVLRHMMPLLRISK